tara:strand:- start:15 stop:407 length:393 start_codon:yes stop_codon:yes gene_type:complete
MEKKATESMENKNYIIIKIDDPNTNKVNFEEVNKEENENNYIFSFSLSELQNQQGGGPKTEPMHFTCNVCNKINFYNNKCINCIIDSKINYEQILYHNGENIHVDNTTCLNNIIRHNIDEKNKLYNCIKN